MPKPMLSAMRHCSIQSRRLAAALDTTPKRKGFITFTAVPRPGTGRHTDAFPTRSPGA
ncbi:hypothetical protein [Nonomuraea turkmeniaca]|uniref:hypothetical protein n=1 Tax=Nonomuraea turkmeniaca TaxID=103838 RepID=UPI001476F21F|nr:hypothetical protein [Nonomuraea turkmeniaca]